MSGALQCKLLTTNSLVICPCVAIISVTIVTPTGHLHTYHEIKMREYEDAAGARSSKQYELRVLRDCETRAAQKIAWRE